MLAVEMVLPEIDNLVNALAPKIWVRHGSAANVFPAYRLMGVVESVFIDAIVIGSIVRFLSSTFLSST
jgi:hypothetical protein